MTTKLQRETRKIELVETDNLARSFSRLNNGKFSSLNRALYHALSMSGCLDYETLTAIREALKLP